MLAFFFFFGFHKHSWKKTIYIPADILWSSYPLTLATFFLVDPHNIKVSLPITTIFFVWYTFRQNIIYVWNRKKKLACLMSKSYQGIKEYFQLSEYPLTGLCSLQFLDSSSHNELIAYRWSIYLLAVVDKNTVFSI